MHQSFETSVPVGPGIAGDITGLKCAQTHAYKCCGFFLLEVGVGGGGVRGGRQGILAGILPLNLAAECRVLAVFCKLKS